MNHPNIKSYIIAATLSSKVGMMKWTGLICKGLKFASNASVWTRNRTLSLSVDIFDLIARWYSMTLTSMCFAILSWWTTFQLNNCRRLIVANLKILINLLCYFISIYFYFVCRSLLVVLSCNVWKSDILKLNVKN